MPTFHPGSADESLAAPIALSVGARITGIDITIASARAYTVTGRVVTAAGSGAPGATITLRKRESRLGIDHDLNTRTQNANGDFEIRGVQTGSYSLVVVRNESEVSTHPLEVGGDMEGVTAVLGSGARVRGKVVVEGDGQIKPGRFSVFLTTDGRRGYFLNPDDKQNATLNNVSPDRYEVRMMGSPQRLYIKSIRSGETDVLADWLTIVQGATVDFEITLASDGGKIEGATLDKNGQPITGATVLLAPELRLRARSGLFKTATTDQSGKFEFLPVAPGEYNVFAWEDVEPGIWNDPEFLKECEKKGEPVTVQAKGHEVVKVAM